MIRHARRGDCAGVPGPYAPPRPAAVVSAYALGTTAVLTFDRPVMANGGPVDDAVTFNGLTPTYVTNAGANELSFALPGFVMGGDPWVVSRQPDYVATAMVWPASGVL